jgi:hypothetical protein
MSGRDRSVNDQLGLGTLGHRCSAARYTGGLGLGTDLGPSGTDLYQSETGGRGWRHTSAYDKQDSPTKTKMTPEQEILYALQWNVSRSELFMAAQLEYDRLRPAWDGGRPGPLPGRWRPPGLPGRESTRQLMSSAAPRRWPNTEVTRYW